MGNAQNITGCAVALLLAGCQDFATLEEGCREGTIRGSQDASPVALGYFGRLTCYRRYAGVSQAKMHRDITEAVQIHANYLQAHVFVEDRVVGQNFYDVSLVEAEIEDQSLTWYRGRNSDDRIREAGFILDNQSYFIWTFVDYYVDDALPRSEVVDQLMHGPYNRDILLAPGWRAGGYAEGEGALGRFGFLNAVLFSPSGTRALSPVVYPVDGQTGIPLDWMEPFRRQPPWDAFVVDLSEEQPPEDWTYSTVPEYRADGTFLRELAVRQVGYPITFTFGSSQELGGRNPTDAFISDSELIGPDGPIEHLFVNPGPHESGSNHSTIAMVPAHALEPNTTYTVTVEASWISRDNKTITTQFTTGTRSLVYDTDVTTAPSARMVGRPAWSAAQPSLLVP